MKRKKERKLEGKPTKSESTKALWTAWNELVISLLLLLKFRKFFQIFTEIKSLFSKLYKVHKRYKTAIAIAITVAAAHKSLPLVHFWTIDGFSWDKNHFFLLLWQMNDWQKNGLLSYTVGVNGLNFVDEKERTFIL